MNTFVKKNTLVILETCCGQYVVRFVTEWQTDPKCTNVTIMMQMCGLVVH